MNLVSSYSLSLAACVSWSQRTSVKLLLLAAPLTSAGSGALLRKLYHDTQCSSQWEKKLSLLAAFTALQNFLVTYN